MGEDNYTNLYHAFSCFFHHFIMLYSTHILHGSGETFDLSSLCHEKTIPPIRSYITIFGIKVCVDD